MAVTKLIGNWQNAMTLSEVPYKCAHCDRGVASVQGWDFNSQVSPVSFVFRIRVCPFCRQPTYFTQAAQIPSPTFGEDVRSLPRDVESLYKQARDCIAANAHTPAVLASRKILMHIAVDLGAAQGLSFLEYVEYLAAKHYVPPNGKGWVDHIRKKGNEANHEISLMTRADGEELVEFLEMLMKFIYEFPGRVPKTPSATTGP